MRSFKFTLDRKSLEVFYFSFIRPILEYADVVWDNLTQSEQDDLEKIQLEASRIICGATNCPSIISILKQALNHYLSGGELTDLFCSTMLLLQDNYPASFQAK